MLNGNWKVGMNSPSCPQMLLSWVFLCKGSEAMMTQQQGAHLALGRVSKHRSPQKQPGSPRSGPRQAWGGRCTDGGGSCGGPKAADGRVLSGGQGANRMGSIRPRQANLNMKTVICTTGMTS